MNTFIVEGRRFTRRLYAVAFAQGLAQEYGRSIDVKVEVKDFQGYNRRSWVCRMHPPNKQVTLLRKTDIPQVAQFAV